jgi:hypothetical protein
MSLVIVPYGGVADIGLSSYSPFRRRAANLSDLKTSNVEQQIPRIQSGTAGYMNCTAHHSRRLISHAVR